MFSGCKFSIGRDSGGGYLDVHLKTDFVEVFVVAFDGEDRLSAVGKDEARNKYR